MPVTIYEQAAQFSEIGAGVAFTSNAVQAMQICHEGIAQAFSKVRTSNTWAEKKNVWFDFHDGYHTSRDDTHAFTISSEIGQAACHRANFLDELVQLFPRERSRFGKRLDRLSQDDAGRWVMYFIDGSTATTDAVVGCDGIKSKLRQLMYGADNPVSYPTYTHKYAYRALMDMEQAVKLLGEEKAMNACMHVSGFRCFPFCWCFHHPLSSLNSLHRAHELMEFRRWVLEAMY